MSTDHDLYIVGAGGFGLEALQYSREAINAGWPYRVKGFLDDSRPIGSVVDGGVQVVGTTNDRDFLASNLLVAIGDPLDRARIAARSRAVDGTLVTLIHSTAYVASSAHVGAGCLICPFAVIGVNAQVGSNVAMNVYASVGHDSTIGSDSVLSPYSAVLGFVSVGEQSYLATHCTVLQGVSVGRNSKVSVAAVVTRSAPAGSLLVGNPAKGRVMFEVPSVIQ